MSIEYQETRDDTLAFIRESRKNICKKFYLIGAIFLPFAIYFLTIYIITKDSEARTMGIAAACGVLLMAVIVIRMRLYFKKAFLSRFEKLSKDGGIPCELQDEGDKIIYITTEYGGRTVIEKNTITKVIVKNDVILLQIHKKTYFAFPNKQEIEDFFKSAGVQLPIIEQKGA